MKDTIKQIIESNLPEKTDERKVATFGEWQAETYGEKMLVNAVLDQINTSLIADEVLKVFREQIEDLPTLYNSIEHLISKDDILDLLDNFSPNKENKNNG